MLRSLPNKFDSRVATIEESKDHSLLSIDELIFSLLSHEKRLNRSRNSSLEDAFKTQILFGRTRKGSYYSRGRGHFTPRGGRGNQQCESRKPTSSSQIDFT